MVGFKTFLIKYSRVVWSFRKGFIYLGCIEPFVYLPRCWALSPKSGQKTAPILVKMPRYGLRVNG